MGYYSDQLFQTIMKTAAPSAWSTPKNVKSVYRQAQDAYALYEPQLRAVLAQMATDGETGAAARFKNLVNMYDAQYRSAAARAANESASAASKADAGFGNTYAHAAAERAYSAALAKKDSAVPKLYQAAQKAIRQEQSAKSKTAAVMQKARAQKADALHSLYSAQLEAASQASAARSKAYAALLKNLKHVYSQALTKKK